MTLSGNEENTLPKITFEELDGLVQFSGRSISSEVTDYYEPFLSYFEEYTQTSPSSLKVDMQLEYYNTKSARLLLNFFNIVKDNLHSKGFDTQINWYYDECDEDSLEAGRDYESIVNIPFTFIEVPEKNS